MTTNPRWLGEAARRGSERAWTLGSVLNIFCSTEGATREQVASLLGCSLDSVAWLSLCRKPRPDHFADDVARIAGRFQIEGSNLAQLIRRVDAIAALREPRDLGNVDPILLAARDRNKEADK